MPSSKVELNFSEIVKSGTLITGGHFMLSSNGPVLNKGTLESFEKAVELYKKCKAEKKKVSLGLLINDIGSVCSESVCMQLQAPSKENFDLPEGYVEILEKNNIKKDECLIFWEKHMRNRGKKLLRKLLAKDENHIVKKNDGYVYEAQDSGVDLVLTRSNGADGYGTPACPLIMCAYALEKKRLGYKRSFNFYYVGDDNLQNVSNHFVIEKGKFLASQFSDDLDVKNVYLFPDSVMKNF